MTGEIFHDYQSHISALLLNCVSVCHSFVLWLLLLACSYVIDLSKGIYMICVCVCVRVHVHAWVLCVTVGRPDDRSEGWFTKRPRASEQNLTTYPSLCQTALSTCPFFKQASALFISLYDHVSMSSLPCYPWVPPFLPSGSVRMSQWTRFLWNVPQL